MNYLVVIPARGGSKGIPLKNIYPLNGKPLLEYTIDVIKGAKLKNTDIVVSTDSDKIAMVAKKREIEVVERPQNISGDHASTEDALIHAIEWMKQRHQMNYDAVITLQPTSPLRKIETLQSFIKCFEENLGVYDALISFTESYSDYWIKNSNGDFKRLQENAPRRRQGRAPLYIENSAYYVTEIQALIKTRSILGTKANGFIISEIEGIDINEPIDLKIANCFLRNIE